MKNLILLHGALGHNSHFDAYIGWLSQSFTVHTLLFEGHGDSDLPVDGITMQHYVRQLHRFCEENQIEETHIFGYSMGGYVALCYAHQQPSRVSSVLTLATKLDWTLEGATKESRMLNPAAIKEKVPKYAARLSAFHGTDKWENLLPAIAGMMIDLGENPILNETYLSQLALPVQLMLGDKDIMVTLDETKRAADVIPAARLAVLPQTKHPLEQVRPQLLMDMMKDFWNL